MNNIDIHADDYGLSLNTSQKILELVNLGKLTGVSVVPNMSAFEGCVTLWNTKLLEDKMPWISIHLNFMEGRCLADPSLLPHLVNSRGLFHISWGTLIKYNYSLKLRRIVKEELKTEIKAQLKRVIKAYHLLDGKKLRIDSHQHTHMIPLVMEALIEVLNENHYPTEYIRISKEPWQVYLSYPKLYFTYSPVNLLKVFILNWYACRNQKVLRDNNIPTMLLCGVFLSGKMDKERIATLYPKIRSLAEKKGIFLEVLFHPGNILEHEKTEEFNHPKATEFYVSKNRKIEYESVVNMPGLMKRK